MVQEQTLRFGIRSVFENSAALRVSLRALRL